MLRTRHLSWLVVLLAISCGTGCYGRFALTRKLYAWNGEISDKFGRQVIFWAMVLIPIYPLAAFGDVVFGNLVEFWSGKNPLAAQDPDFPVERLANGGVRAVRDGKVIEVRPDGDGRFGLFVDEVEVARGQVDLEDGALLLTDLTTGRVHRLLPEQFNAGQI